MSNIRNIRHLFLHNSNDSSISTVGVGLKDQIGESFRDPRSQFGFLGAVIQRISRSTESDRGRRSRRQRKLEKEKD